MLVLPSLLGLVLPSLGLVPPRVAVWGGSGFVGSRVCRTLVGAGCSVVSLSRTGKPPPWCLSEGWSGEVEWQSADALSFSDDALSIGSIDLCVTCVGNMRPSPSWQPGSFFGLHWDYERMVRENGPVSYTHLTLPTKA